MAVRCTTTTTSIIVIGHSHRSSPLGRLAEDKNKPQVMVVAADARAAAQADSAAPPCCCFFIIWRGWRAVLPRPAVVARLLSLDERRTLVALALALVTN